MLTMYRLGLLLGFVYPISRAWVLWMAETEAEAEPWFTVSHNLAVIFTLIVFLLFVAISTRVSDTGWCCYCRDRNVEAPWHEEAVRYAHPECIAPHWPRIRRINRLLAEGQERANTIHFRGD